MKKNILAAMLATGLLLTNVHATAADASKPAAAGTMQMSDATVGKIDKATDRVTLSHGPIPNLDMPPMRMLFRVKDKAWLDKMKQGDKIRFMAELINGAYTVVHFEPAP